MEDRCSADCGLTDPRTVFAEVEVNLTGSATVMGHAAQQLGEHARRLAAPVRPVALVDRRPLPGQQAPPWVTGEVVRLQASTTVGQLG